MTHPLHPVGPADLPRLLAERIASIPGRVRVAIDGAEAARPAVVGTALAEPLRLLGRPAAVVSTELFWRDASLRLEHGREDAHGYPDWLDEAALRREVLEAARAGRYLPSLRDPLTNRSTRAAARPLPADGVLLVAGQFLLGRALPFELTVHLSLSPGALARRTRPELAWTLPAFARYDRGTDPAAIADVWVRLDHPHRPAARGLPGPS